MMFGLFNKKKYQPTVTPEDKDWVEKNLIWFIQVFGLERLRAQPFIPPTKDHFPYSDLKDPGQFQQLFEQLCKYWEINPDEITVKFFDDFKSKEWTAWVPQGPSNEPGGLYTQLYTTDKKRFQIQLAKSTFDNPDLLITILAHELAHVKLLGGNYMTANTAGMEPLTDLASIFFGFGVFVANNVQTQGGYWITRTGYLPDQVISYANALICYITNHNAENYKAVLNQNTNSLFSKDFEYLRNTNNTILTKEVISQNELTYKLSREIDEGFEKKNFNRVIDACNQLIKVNPKDISALNNIGYALLLQKKYRDAIAQFTAAIGIAPYWEYPYNNRGYCKLQLGDLESAFVDLEHSYEMNSGNSFSWRNIGAYYLETNEFEKALQYLQEAEKIDPKTELINFYLGQAYLKLENLESAQQYFDKSKALNEHNDSMIG